MLGDRWYRPPAPSPSLRPQSRLITSISLLLRTLPSLTLPPGFCGVPGGCRAPSFEPPHLLSFSAKHWEEVGPDDEGVGVCTQKNKSQLHDFNSIHIYGAPQREPRDEEAQDPAPGLLMGRLGKS